MKILHVLYELKFSGAEIMYVDAADEFRSLGCELYVINSAERLGKYADMLKMQVTKYIIYLVRVD